MTPDSNGQASQAAIAQAIQDVTEKAQVVIREEIELAKVEIETKVKSLVKGAVVGVAAGIFVITGLLFLLHGFSWLAYWAIPFPDNQVFWGFFVVAGALFLLGGLAGFLAMRAFTKGSPPTPQMAIEEAQRIRETVQSPEPEKTV
jgi:hypothetical protein